MLYFYLYQSLKYEYDKKKNSNCGGGFESRKFENHWFIGIIYI